MPDGTLTGLKVVQLREQVADPFCQKVMEYVGAKLVKIE